MNMQSNELAINSSSSTGGRFIWQSIRDFVTVHGSIEASLPSKLQIVTWLLLSIGVGVIAILQSGHYQIGTYMDDASYVVLSQSIIQGPTYGLISAPQTPLPSRYPFGFPLLLSPFTALFSNQLILLTRVSFLFTLVNIALLFWGWPYLSKAKSYWWGLAVAALSGLSPLVIGHTDMVMSEPAFTTFMLLALILTEICVANNRRLWLSSILLGMSIALAISIRTIGMALLVAVLARLVFVAVTRRSKALRIFTGTLAGIFIFYAVILIVTPVKLNTIVPVEYIDQFESPNQWGLAESQPTLISRFFEGVGFYVLSGVRDVILPVGGGEKEIAFGQRFGISNLPIVIGIVISVFIVVGALAFLTGSGTHPTILFFEIAYFGALAVWPWRLSRFLYPIQPFLMLHLLCGVMFVVAAIKMRLPRQSTNAARRPSAEILFAGLVGITFIALSLYRVLPSQASGLQHTRDLSVGTDWLRTNTTLDAAVFAEQPESIYLYSGRKTITYPQFEDADDLKASMKKAGIGFIFVAPVLEWRNDGLLAYDTYTSTNLIPMLDSLVSAGEMKLVYQSDPKDKIVIYQLVVS